MLGPNVLASSDQAGKDSSGDLPLHSDRTASKIRYSHFLVHFFSDCVGEMLGESQVRKNLGFILLMKT